MDAKTIKELNHKQIEAELKGTKYEGCSEGNWSNDFQEDDDEQTDVNIGVPELVYDDTGKWGMFEPIAETSTDGEKTSIANIELLTDAKENAAKAIMLEKQLEKLLQSFELTAEVLGFKPGQNEPMPPSSTAKLEVKLTSQWQDDVQRAINSTRILLGK